VKTTHPGPAPAFSPKLRRLLEQKVRGLVIDEKQIREHVIRPPNLEGVFSDRGPAESPRPFVPNPVVDVRPHRLNVTTFATALDDALIGKVAGFSVQLRRQGQAIFTRDSQWAKAPQDGAEGWTPDVQAHVASVSKLITGMVMTRLLEEKGISPDASILDYLPDYWTKGPNLAYIHFRHLMNHISGLKAPTNTVDFQIIKAAIAGGTSFDPTANDYLGNYRYTNVDFGLCRVLLAVINGNIDRSFDYTDFLDYNDLIWDWVSINAYAQFSQTNVFRPAGVYAETFDHPDGAGLAYPGPDETGSGWNSGNLQNGAGAFGWHLSVDQLLNVMGEFRRGRGILSPESAQGMLDNGFGVDPFPGTVQPGAPIPGGLRTPAGEIYCKRGNWVDDAHAREEQAVAFFLPEDMELALVVNSPLGDPGGSALQDTVTQVYLTNLTTQLANE
jgi:CubicO group peptidase (beta-lactamase class C family)